jgi:hypothetical protein
VRTVCVRGRGRGNSSCTCGDLWAEGGVLPPLPNTAKRLAMLMDGVLCLGGGSGGSSSCLGGISWRGKWEAGIVGGDW